MAARSTREDVSCFVRSTLALFDGTRIAMFARLSYDGLQQVGDPSRVPRTSPFATETFRSFRNLSLHRGDNITPQHAPISLLITPLLNPSNIEYHIRLRAHRSTPQPVLTRRIIQHIRRNNLHTRCTGRQSALPMLRLFPRDQLSLLLLRRVEGSPCRIDPCGRRLSADRGAEEGGLSEDGGGSCEHVV